MSSIWYAPPTQRDVRNISPRMLGAEGRRLALWHPARGWYISQVFERYQSLTLRPSMLRTAFQYLTSQLKDKRKSHG
jgi:hypothetical protein